MKKTRTPGEARATEEDRQVDAVAESTGLAPDEAARRLEVEQRSEANAREQGEVGKAAMDYAGRAKLIEALVNGVRLPDGTEKVMDWDAAVQAAGRHIRRDSLAGNKAEILQTAQRRHAAKAELDGHNARVEKLAQRQTKIADVRRQGYNRQGLNEIERKRIVQLLRVGERFEVACRIVVQGQVDPAALEAQRVELEALATTPERAHSAR